jgi:site-specific DNA recombinase
MWYGGRKGQAGSLSSPRRSSSQGRALIIRVSTDNQAKNPEGSRKNQLQRLRAHIGYKTNTRGENWLEAEQYILPGVSGKKSFHSKQFQQLFDDIRSGKVNTILVTALDRVCRSVKDFLAFFEILNKYNVEFVCLKQNYDTTSPQGRLFITIMMALAEFERDQTSDRNKESSLARAERGLWNGGHLLGYDLPTDGKKGTLVPNEREAAIVNFGFESYLKTGSILRTAQAMNAQGFRTKEYDSRRGTDCSRGGSKPRRPTPS